MFDSLSSELKTRIEKLRKFLHHVKTQLTPYKKSQFTCKSLKNSKSFITEEHTKSSDAHYAGNLTIKKMMIPYLYIV